MFRRNPQEILSQFSWAAFQFMKRSASFRVFPLGIILGCSFLAVLHYHYAWMGSSLKSVSCAMVAVSFGIWLAGRKWLNRFSGRLPWLPAWMIPAVCLTFGALLLPSTQYLQVTLLDHLELETLSRAGVQWSIYGLVSFCLLTLPAFCLVRVGSALACEFAQPVRQEGDSDEESDTRSSLARLRYHRYSLNYYWGVLGGIFLSAFCIAPFWGVQIGAWIAALGLVVMIMERLLRAEPAEQADSSWLYQDVLQTELQPLVHKLWQGAAWACVGGLLVILSRFFTQYMPAVSYLTISVWCSFAAGLLLGLYWFCGDRKSASEKNPSRQVLACLFVAAWSVLWFASSDWLIEWGLWSSSHISQVWGLVSLRIFIMLLALAPIGVACVALASSNSSSRPVSLLSLCSSYRLAYFVLGWLGMRWLLIQGVSLINLATCCQWALLVLAGLSWVKSWKISYRRWEWGAIAAALILVVSAPMANRQFSLSETGKLLFSTNVFMGYLKGLAPEELTVLDDTRLVEVVEGESETFSVWQQRGAQITLKANNLPQSMASLDRRVMPENTSELLQVILPMTIHRAPRKVMIMGVQSGLTSKTCLEFPVQELICCESDPALVELARKYCWKNQTPEEDIRFSVTNLDPQLALQGSSQLFDVLIASPPASMTYVATGSYTSEYYQNAAYQLDEEGIFCQKFPHVDYGTQPLCDLVKTMQTAFAHVVGVKCSQGDILMLGTNSSQGLDRAGMLRRLRKPHTRQALASVGWDWVNPLNLLVLDEIAFAEILEKNPGKVNSASNGRFAFGLPREMLRWGNKGEELQTLCGSHFGNIYGWVQDEDTDKQVAHRMEEIKTAQRIQSDYTDQYTAYRKEVRKRIQDHPRTVIEQVKGGDPEEHLHDEDQRRLKYFFDLGQIMQSSKIDHEKLQAMEQYATPYDPLISLFLHGELAELYNRIPAEESSAEIRSNELRHLLHSVYFSSLHNKSVRNASRALKLLVTEEQLVPDQETRADLINGLLQVLVQRWTVRGTMPLASLEISHNDVNVTLEAVEAACGFFDELPQEKQLEHLEWPSRKEYVQRHLVRPLRTYRSQLSQASANQEFRRQERGDSAGALREESGQTKRSTEKQAEEAVDNALQQLTF